MKNKQIKKIATLLIFLSIFCQTSQYSFAKTTKKSKISITRNGDLSTQILISEVFPNPKGTDTGKEWIEILNKENHNINLGNWSITILNTSKNTKPKIIKLSDKTIIKANSYLLIDSTFSKFSILNNTCKIELKDFVGKSIDNIQYENSEENLSLSHIEIFKTNKKITTWTTPTKNTQNQIYYEISGKIEEKTQNNIKITTSDNKLIDINIPPTENWELLNNTIKEKDQVLFLVEKNKEGNYRFLDFKIEKQNQEPTKGNTSSENWIYYGLGLAIIGLIWLFHNTFSLHRAVYNLRNIRSR